MDIRRQLMEDACDVTLSGRFTFNDHQKFREVLDEFARDSVHKVALHVAGLEFIDSAGLGMLLLALDEAGKHRKELVINGATGQVKQVFDMARFDTMFTMT